MAKLEDLQHPMQPLGYNEAGTVRFKPNKIVEALLDRCAGYGYGLNEIRQEVGDEGPLLEDYTHFMQLIGYSANGYLELSTTPDNLATRTQEIWDRLIEDKSTDDYEGTISRFAPYVYRPTLLQHVIEDLSEPFEEAPYRKDAPPSRILFISRGEDEKYDPIILGWIGEAADYMHDGGDMADALRGYPAGTWIWEGTVVGSSYSTWDGMEYDSWPEGDIRDLTDEEWEWLAESPEDAPWDPSLWYEIRD